MGQVIDGAKTATKLVKAVGKIIPKGSGTTDRGKTDNAYKPGDLPKKITYEHGTDEKGKWVRSAVDINDYVYWRGLHRFDLRDWRCQNDFDGCYKVIDRGITYELDKENKTFSIVGQEGCWPVVEGDIVILMGLFGTKKTILSQKRDTKGQPVMSVWSPGPEIEKLVIKGPMRYLDTSYQGNGSILSLSKAVRKDDGVNDEDAEGEEMIPQLNGIKVVDLRESEIKFIGSRCFRWCQTLEKIYVSEKVDKTIFLRTNDDNGTAFTGTDADIVGNYSVGGTNHRDDRFGEDALVRCGGPGPYPGLYYSMDQHVAEWMGKDLEVQRSSQCCLLL